MRPKKLVMQAFGPYPDREEVDFSELSKAGIFLIKGPTGSGKTTIFDAMSIALYGKSTGEDDRAKNGRNDFEGWRCNQADWSVSTIVEFEFESNGVTYRFIRKLEPRRKNLDPVYAVDFLDTDGEFKLLPGFENPREADVSKKAEELIGLTCNQFRQVVLLPQGKFERFLSADSSQKEEILGKLFDAEQWGGFAEALFDKVDDRYKGLVEEKKSIDSSLSEENVDSVEALQDIIDSKKNYIAEIEKNHEKFDPETKKKKLEEEKKVALLFDRVRELGKQETELREQAALVEDDREKLVLADKAENFRNAISSVQKLEKDITDRKKHVTSLCSKTEEFVKTEETAKISFEEFDLEGKLKEINGRIEVLSSKKARYAEIDEVKAAFAEAEQKLNEAENKKNTAGENLENAKKSASNCYDAYSRAERETKNKRDRYYAEIYGEIASELKEGERCPVCGSIEHPSPAVKSSDSITKDMLEAAEEYVELTKKTWETAEKARENTQTVLTEATAKLEEARQKKETVAVRWSEIQKELIEGIENSEQLENAIKELEKKVQNVKTESTELESAYNDAKTKLQKHSNSIAHESEEINKLEKTYGEESAELMKKLADSGYPDAPAAERDMLADEKRNALRERITSYDTLVRKNKEELSKAKTDVEGKTEPDKDSFKERQKAIEDEAVEYTDAKAREEIEVARLSKKLDPIGKKKAHYEANWKQAESELAFARKLRGDTGVGLQRYVLGIMFNRIIGEANRMLLMVHGGRYSLFRTDNKGAGNKRGLELLVHDNRKPEEPGRTVGSLSGGEKFLVSLALSIGMSAAAQKSGLKIEALFIDEGFGTLDDDSISDAMDILECVQKNNGMIGIISHVSILESNIPKHLEVVKTENGSHIRMC